MGTRVNSSSINANSTGAASYTVSLGVAVQTGDVIVIAGASQGTHAANGMSASMTATSEAFSTIKEQQGGNASSRWLQTFIYVATQAFLSSDTITFTPYAASTQNSFSVDIFRGYTSTVDQTVQGQSNASGTNTAPALTANATANALVLTFIETGSGTLTAGSPFSTGSTNATNQATGIGFVLAASGASTYGSTWTLGTAGTNATETVSYLAAATDIPYSPQRYSLARDYGTAPWLQRDRRDANTVATAPNPLTAPLDSAWQADGRYQHLYNDTAARDRRVYFYQRAYVSNPSLLGTALLENELLGGADTAKRYNLPATHTDRREVPQQRAYVSDPLLLTTAQLDELLGSADIGKRYLTPATHTPRWWMPQQPPRWTVYFDAGPDVPPLTLSWGADGRYSTLYNQAGWQPDRREVPQQRAYISDPSFYPTTAPTDPLTVAWGAGGHYWLIYNTAGLYTDRREVPQQPARVADPTLITTALLENELLGGADTARHYLTPATHADRRLVPQQRLYVSDPALLTTALLEDALLGGADDRTRRYTLWAYDRRETACQQPRWSVPDAQPADPLLVAGGDLWRRYATAATHADRRQTVRQPDRWLLFFSTNVPGVLTPSTAGPRLGPATAAAGLAVRTAGSSVGGATTAARISLSTSGGHA